MIVAAAFLLTWTENTHINIGPIEDTSSFHTVSGTKAHCFPACVDFLSHSPTALNDYDHSWLVATCNKVVECTDTTHVDKRSEKQLNCNNWNCSPATVILSTCHNDLALGKTPIPELIISLQAGFFFFSFIHAFCVHFLLCVYVLLCPKWALRTSYLGLISDFINCNGVSVVRSETAVPHIILGKGNYYLLVL